jgi:hypothetical protein
MRLSSVIELPPSYAPVTRRGFFGYPPTLRAELAKAKRAKLENVDTNMWLNEKLIPRVLDSELPLLNAAISLLFENSYNLSELTNAQLLVYISYYYHYCVRQGLASPDDSAVRALFADAAKSYNLAYTSLNTLKDKAGAVKWTIDSDKKRMAAKDALEGRVIDLIAQDEKVAEDTRKELILKEDEKDITQKEPKESNMALVYAICGVGIAVGIWALTKSRGLEGLEGRHYVTSFCNHPHDLATGRPIGHECYVLPHRALQYERGGYYEEAQRLIQKMSRKVVRGR